jgi:hypothetical protein
MTTLDAGITDVPLSRQRSVMGLLAAVLAVAAFVAVSLALKSAAHLALVSFGLIEDAYGQCAEFTLISGASMFAARKLLDLTALQYNGKIIVLFFMAISGLTMAFALSSGIMKVDFFISFLQMSALCAFAYLQFWTQSDRAHSRAPG